MGIIKSIILIMIFLILTGCSSKTTKLIINPDQCKDGINYFYIDARGVKVETLTDQKSNGEIPVNLNLPLGNAE